jgi:hypothetical protein
MCGCVGVNKEKVNQTTVTRMRQSIKKVWENTQAEKPTHIVKRINKKVIKE